MIVLDTNVVSEIMRPRPNEVVMASLDSRPRSHYFLTSISLAEIAFGIELAPSPQRRRELETRFEQFRTLGFGNQLLPFDEAAAWKYAAIVAGRKRMGRPISQSDAQIASIAVVRDFSVATRNVCDFEHCGVTLINPWTE